MPVSYRLQGAIDATNRQSQRRKIAGYIMTAVIILVLAYALWWVIAVGSNRRNRAIERFRGGEATVAVSSIPV